MLRVVCVCLLVIGAAGVWFTHAADAFGSAPIAVSMRESFGGDQFFLVPPAAAASDMFTAATAAGEAPVDAPAEPAALRPGDDAAAAAMTEADMLAETNRPWTFVSGLGALALVGGTLVRRFGNAARRRR